MEYNFTILAIDDDPIIIRSLKRVLSSEPYRILTTTDPQQGLLLLEQETVDLVLLDLKMPGYDGMAFLRDITSLYPGVATIMLTGHGGVQQAVEAIKLGAVDFLEKPCPPEVLCQRLAIYRSIWLEQQRWKKGKPAFTYPGLIGESPAMEDLKSLIVRIASSDVSVLIQGESGTGKELVARAVHHHSVRRSGPFIPVDCAAINESVLESELFGHEKGAFTGADSSVKGLIRSADGGTLFLDEIGELPITMQAKLLRTLQEHEVRPVGSSKSFSVNIRVLAATNRSLVQEIGRGAFRSDLFYRLAAMVIDLPSLRERGDDISILARYFIDRYGQSHIHGMSDDALHLLHQYTWPGNVRELGNVIRRAIILTEQDRIEVADLPATIMLNRSEIPHPVAAEFKTENDSLYAYERVALENALKKTGNNRRQAAALLGIAEATLYRKLKQFNLS